MIKFLRNERVKKSGIFCLGFLSCLVVTFLIQKNNFSSTIDKIQRTELSQVENTLRKSVLKLQVDYSVQLKLVRKKNQLILRIWDDQIFPINDWSVSARGQSLIADLSKELQKIEKNVQFEVSGHYDSVDPLVGGEKEVNKVSITTHRAAQVAGILAGHGLDMERLEIKGYGDSRPLFNDRDQYGEYIAQAGELNRRLEIRVRPGRLL